MHLESADFDFTRPDTTLVIAEAGVNHNGDPLLARRMIDVAREAGADIVKFQAFNAEQEISRYAPKASYQKENTGADGNQLDLCKALELSGEALKSLMQYCAKIRMPFLCTAFDVKFFLLSFLLRDNGGDRCFSELQYRFYSEQALAAADERGRRAPRQAAVRGVAR